LVAENLCLRQQLLVLQRGPPQARPRNAAVLDLRQSMVRWLAQFAFVVKPETVLGGIDGVGVRTTAHEHCLGSDHMAGGALQVLRF
jgi:hypothetical protein